MKKGISPRRKQLAKAVTAAALGLSLLAGSGTLASWKAAESITTQERTIQAGELSLEHSASTGAWTLNGVSIPAEDLASVSIVPGDKVAYAGTETPRVVGDTLKGWMYFTGVDAVSGTLAGSPAASLAWAVDGVQEPKLLTPAEHLVAQPVSFSVTMAPIGDPIYATGSEAQRLTLDLSTVHVAVSMIKPAGGAPGGSTPPVEEPEDADNYWPIEGGLRDAVKRELGIDREPTLDDAPLLTSLDASDDLSIEYTYGLEYATNLASLDLSGTSVTSVDALYDTPEAFSKVTSLNLSRTPIAEHGFAFLYGFPSLTHLDLSHTGLDGTYSLSLANPELLTHLNLSGTQVKELYGRWDLRNLQHVDLSDTQVNSFPDVASFEHLEYLDLSGTQMSDLSDFEYAGDSLRYLDLSRTQVTDISVLQYPYGLVHLDLSGTQVADISALEQQGDLEYLDLSDTLVTDWTPVDRIMNVIGRP